MHCCCGSPVHTVAPCHACRTQLANRTSELLLVEDGPINDMVFDSQSSALWVATASSSVRRYSPRQPVSRAHAQIKLMMALHYLLMSIARPFHAMHLSSCRHTGPVCISGALLLAQAWACLTALLHVVHDCKQRNMSSAASCVLLWSLL